MEIKLTKTLFTPVKGLLLLMMRTFIILFCTSVFSITPELLISQNTRITIDTDKEATIDEVFDMIAKQTDYTFMYQYNLFKGLPKIQLKKGIIRMDKLINQGMALGKFNVVLSANNTILIKEAAPVQQSQVSGKVTDNKGQPVPGAAVIVKGTGRGTATGLEGNYSILVPNPENVLVFSALGFITQEITVAGKTEINVVMVEDIGELEQVTISTGYQKIKPEQSTGSITTVGIKEFDSRINTTDFLTGLQNKIPGLLINNDVKFEGNSLFQIRGISTINGNKNPLIVIDGFPTELSLDAININDIKSVTVLKDAAAATIYGVRASNGVIVIERKNAKVGKPVVTFRTTASMTPKENFDRYRWDKDGGNTYLNFYRERNPNISPSLWANMNNPSFGWRYNYPIPGNILAQQKAGVITSEQADQIFAELGAYNNSKDYGRLFLRTAMTQTYDLGVSGGTENALYYITANYVNNNESQIKNDNNQFKLSARTTLNLTKRLSVDLTTDYQQAKSMEAPVPDINNIYAFERFQDDNGNPLPLYNGSKVNPYYNATLINRGLYDNMYYPLVDVNEISDNSVTTNNHITANFSYDIGNGFKLKFGGVYETSHTDSKHLASENSSEARQYINLYAKDDGFGGFIHNVPRGGFLQHQTGSTEGYTVRALLNYDKQISEDHSLNLIVGGEARGIITKSNKVSYFGYNEQTLFQLPIDYKLLTVNFQPSYAGMNKYIYYNDLFNEGYKETRYVSAYFNTVYAYKGKYSLSGSIRIDQSNLFGVNSKYRYKPLWSVGAAWNISKENFIKDISWVNNLKLHISEGFNGNVAENILPQVIATSGYNYQTTEPSPMLSISSYANSRLRWEQTRNFNIGLDYTIFKNIDGNIDYYIKKSTDLLASNQIDATKGGNSALINQATVRNNGLEVSLHADWITREEFNWNTGLIFAHNNSKVLKVYNTSIGETSFSANYVYGSNANYLEGYAIGSLFSYRYAGVDNTGRPMIYDKEGNAKVIFTNDEGRDEVDYVGSSIPKFNMGLSNRVDIGSFYAYVMVNYYGGFKVRTPMPNPSTTRPLEGAANYWRMPGDEVDPDILSSRAFSYYDPQIQASDKYTFRGDYLTLGDITFAYSFRNSELIEKFGLSNLEIRAQASNIYTVAFNEPNYSLATGSYAKTYLTPTYAINVNINF